MGNPAIIGKKLTLGGNDLDVVVSQIKNPVPIFYVIEGFYSKGINQTLADKDFVHQVWDYSRENKYNFVFAPRDIEKRKREVVGYKGGVMNYICQGNILFMENLPSQISEKEHMHLVGKITIDEFLEMLKDRGSNPQPINNR